MVQARGLTWAQPSWMCVCVCRKVRDMGQFEFQMRVIIESISLQMSVELIASIQTSDGLLVYEKVIGLFVLYITYIKTNQTKLTT